MKDKIKKYFKERYKIILLIIVLCTVTVVSAAYDEEMTITGNGIIRVDEDIRITNVKLIDKTGESYEQYNSRYSKDKTSMFVVLPSNTTITYEVEITNKDINNYYLKQIKLENNLDEGISYEILNYNSEYLIDKNTTLKLQVQIRNNSNDTKTTNLILKYIFEHDSVLPTWKITEVENNNVLTTSIFNMEITGEDNYKEVTSTLSEKDIEFYVGDTKVNPIAIEVSKKQSVENTYNLKVVMIGKEGNLTLKVKENTLKDKAGNYNNLNTIESNIKIEKNKETKIFIFQAATSVYIYNYIKEYYTNIKVSDTLNEEEITNNNYDIVIFDKSYSYLPTEINGLFKKHINLLTQANDNWAYTANNSYYLDIIKSNGYRDGSSSAHQVLAKKMIENNLTKYMPETFNETLEQQTLIKFKEEVSVLYQYEYNDQIYDLMGLYSKDNTNWLHIHSAYYVSFYYALMVEYVLGHLSEN